MQHKISEQHLFFHYLTPIIHNNEIISSDAQNQHHFYDALWQTIQQESYYGNMNGYSTSSASMLKAKFVSDILYDLCTSCACFSVSFAMGYLTGMLGGGGPCPCDY